MVKLGLVLCCFVMCRNVFYSWVWWCVALRCRARYCEVLYFEVERCWVPSSAVKYCFL